MSFGIILTQSYVNFQRPPFILPSSTFNKTKKKYFSIPGTIFQFRRVQNPTLGFHHSLGDIQTKLLHIGIIVEISFGDQIPKTGIGLGIIVEVSFGDQVPKTGIGLGIIVEISLGDQIPKQGLAQESLLKSALVIWFLNRDQFRDQY